MKRYINFVLRLSSVIILFYIIFHQRQQIKELKTTIHEIHRKTQIADSLIRITDSLNNEIFVEHTKVDRYEIALERLEEADSLSATMFKIQLGQTE